MNVDTIDFAQITLGAQIGAGTYGKVYSAKWRSKNVAVKRIIVDDEDEVERTEKESKHLARAAHINIIFLYGVAKHEECTYLIMEYMDGGSLSDFLYKEQQEYTWKHVVNWARQAADAVAYLHSTAPRSVIHRDLKPRNMLLCDNRRCLKICDFGTVRVLASMMTKNSGTAAYMAPEVFSGHKYTEKCDVYSWGITLWEMLARKQPYNPQVNSDINIMNNVGEGLRPSIEDLIISCSDDILKLMQSCWSKEPNERPSMKVILKVLEEYKIDVEELSL